MELQIIKDRIITVRDQQVILDTDVAVLYGVETKHINQAIKNNPEKFPEGYIISLSQSEKGGNTPSASRRAEESAAGRS